MDGVLINGYAEWFVDQTNKLAITDMYAKEEMSRTVQEKPKMEICTFGLSVDTYWVRFKVTNPTDKKIRWVLETEEIGNG